MPNSPLGWLAEMERALNWAPRRTLGGSGSEFHDTYSLLAAYSRWLRAQGVSCG